MLCVLPLEQECEHILQAVCMCPRLRRHTQAQAHAHVSATAVSLLNWNVLQAFPANEFPEASKGPSKRQPERQKI